LKTCARINQALVDFSDSQTKTHSQLFVPAASVAAFSFLYHTHTHSDFLSYPGTLPFPCPVLVSDTLVKDMCANLIRGLVVARRQVVDISFNTARLFDLSHSMYVVN